MIIAVIAGIIVITAITVVKGVGVIATIAVRLIAAAASLIITILQRL